MSRTPVRTWQAVQGEIRRRISQRTWKPGEYIPNEADLAQEFACARATMNRALRGLAEEGLLERRRKAGTRVALNPVRAARFEIPVIRDEIEGKGLSFRYAVLERSVSRPPPDVRARLQSAQEDRHLHLHTLYTADGVPYVFEDRWINLRAVPQARDETFATLSPNEWLVREVPFDGGGFTLSATVAAAPEAEVLACPPGEGLVVLDRTTRNAGLVITSVRLMFHAGYRMHTEL